MPVGFFGFITVFGLSVVLTFCFRIAAVRYGLVDTPDARKLHDGRVPLCGGIAMFSAFAVAAAIIGVISAVPWNLAVALLLLTLCGAADDRWRLPVLPRLLVHFIAAIMVVVPAIALGINFGSFLHLSDPALLPVALVVSTLLVVGLINATNMTDGADGLCGGWGAGALFWLAILAQGTGQARLASISLLLLAAVVGFLAFNMRHPWRSRASVFMGDAGSIALGGALGFLVITLAAGLHGIPLPFLAWIVAVPMTDMASLVIRRLLARRSPMSADRWHLHHLLLDMGMPHATAVGLLVLVSTACGAVAWAAYVLKAPDSLVAAGLAVPVIAHTAFVLVATRRVAVRTPNAQFSPSQVIKVGTGETR